MIRTMLDWIAGKPQTTKAIKPKATNPKAKNPKAKSPNAKKTRNFTTRDFSLPIVGESHYQANLGRTKKSLKDYGGTAYTYVHLQREPNNKDDANAIKVMNESDQTLGYLSREDAVRYNPALELWESKGYLIRCQAMLAGGTEEKPSIGAWLDLREPDAIEATFHNPETRK